MNTEIFSYAESTKTFYTEVSTLGLIPTHGFFMDVGEGDRRYFALIEEHKNFDGDIMQWKFQSSDKEYFAIIFND